MSKGRCKVYKEYCPVHDFIHGVEAEELRKGIERIIERGDPETIRDDLQGLLDRVDARDSVAFLEAQERR